MALILKVTSYKGLPPGQEIRAQFDTQGGTIGRAPDNHLVLPDPEKFISRLHASIVFTAGQYFIQDSSTGGTYLYNNDNLLQQSRAVLNDGEKLRIGEYELLVSISDNVTGGLSTAEIDIPVRQLDFADSRVLDDPFSAAKHSRTDSGNGFLASFIEQPESSPIHQSFTPPQTADIPPAANHAGVDELDFSDLLSTLDSLPGTSPRPLRQAELPPLPADFFADSEEKAEPGMTHGDPPENARPAEVKPLQDPFAGFEAPAFQDVHPAPMASEPVTTAVEVDTPEAAPGRVAPPAAAMPADDRLLREFLAGAGINDPGFLPPEQWPALMRTSGELLRGMVDGLMQVLRARAELKSQFRVSVTTMRSIDNNPLKFTPSVDDAIKLMLAPTNPGFLPPKAAVSEGFRDIMNHQIAVTAGIQAALEDILRSFDPRPIEKNQAEGVLFQKKAKCWEYYVENYPQLKAVAQEEFFGDAFADAYEKQMLLLSRSSKQQ